ncbi:MAG: 4-hydroxy-tetrahydrodipicolinate synthase [Proteobacteria bacterium]|nr:4-hydroxy-tetrahydrodipicolinate synthase [Pseudomonadota bacterium]
MFHGIYTAIITPFRNGEVDEKSLEELVELQIAAGVQGIVTCGTTGEALLLSWEEQKQILEMCVSLCKDRCQLIASTGHPSTTETITLTRQAKDLGADGALVITPWYVKPSQESLYEHYKKISETVDLPIIIYNNPTRTGVDMSFDTLMRLASCKNIQGYKDSASCVQRISQLKQYLGSRLSLLAGNDDPFAAHLGMGGDGGILVASNVIPELCVELMKAWTEGDLPLFRATWEKIFPLLSVLALESNPAPIKYAMHLVHGISDESRLPFSPLKTSTKEAIEIALNTLGLWKPLASVRER